MPKRRWVEPRVDAEGYTWRWVSLLQYSGNCIMCGRNYNSSVFWCGDRPRGERLVCEGCWPAFAAFVEGTRDPRSVYSRKAPRPSTFRSYQRRRIREECPRCGEPFWTDLDEDGCVGAVRCENCDQEDWPD